MNNRLMILLIGLILLSCGRLRADDCPSGWDAKPLLEYLQHYQANSLEADPLCVQKAFATVAQSKAYYPSLIELLDFERSTKSDGHERLFSRSAQYPAIDALTRQDAVPSLIHAIKDSDKELVRVNAAEALAQVYAVCILIPVEMLEAEATKATTTDDQQQRLRSAEEYMRRFLTTRPCRQRPSTVNR
jgi:hypothetical protein